MPSLRNDYVTENNFRLALVQNGHTKKLVLYNGTIVLFQLINRIVSDDRDLVHTEGLVKNILSLLIRTVFKFALWLATLQCAIWLARIPRRHLVGINLKTQVSIRPKDPGFCLRCLNADGIGILLRIRLKMILPCVGWNRIWGISPRQCMTHRESIKRVIKSNSKVHLKALNLMKLVASYHACAKDIVRVFTFSRVMDSVFCQGAWKP